MNLNYSYKCKCIILFSLTICKFFLLLNPKFSEFKSILQNNFVNSYTREMKFFSKLIDIDIFIFVLND